MASAGLMLNNGGLVLNNGGLVLNKGKVGSFDADVGLGDVLGEDGRRYPFHCTEIADGSRRIEVGAEVEFVVAPGHRGIREARAVDRRR
jgi:cold shock CspA family protein